MDDEFRYLLSLFERFSIKPITKSEFVEKLIEVGVEKSDILYIHSQLFLLGNVEGASSLDEYLNKILECFFEVITSEGTIVVPTFTTRVIKQGIPFILEETESDTGLFAEFIRKHPDSVRSLHPVNSFSAIGRRKYEICSDVPQTNYGLDTPMDRMAKLGAKGVLLGMELTGDAAYTISLLHHIEAMYNVPYVYNKIIDAKVIAGGKCIDKIFIGNFRYLDFDIQMGTMRTNFIHRHLIEGGLIRSAYFDKRGIYVVNFSDYINECVSLLKKDIYSLLDYPPSFVRGVIPYK
jgi:aminoglycoside 3-N-acetyltransferase